MIFSPPGTSPRPVRPSESSSTTTLRVKYGAWAPERFRSIESRPATGYTEKRVTTGWGMAVRAVLVKGAVGPIPWKGVGKPDGVRR